MGLRANNLLLFDDDKIHMIFPVSSFKGTRPLISWVLAEGFFTSSRGVGIGKVPSRTVTFGVLPNSRVTMFVVTFFCSDFSVRTPASTKAWILSLRTKHLSVGWWTILWKRQYLGSFVRPISFGMKEKEKYYLKVMVDCTLKLHFYHHFYTYILDHSFIS